MNHRILLLLLLGTTAMAYAGLGRAGFAWDDYSLVRDNALTGDWANFSQFFSVDLWESTRLAPTESGFYRPLFLVSLAVDRSLFGLSAGAAHLHSVFWHLIAIALLFRLGQRIHSSRVGIIAATLFALHPVQHEAVALIAARNDSMATAFVLLTVLLLLDSPTSRRRLVLGAICFFCALLSKESALLTPVFLWLLDRNRRPQGHQRNRYLSLGIALVAYLVLRLQSSVGASPWPSPKDWSNGFGKLPEILGSYAEMLVWPSYLTPARSVDYLDALPHLLPFLGAVSLLFAALLLRGRSNRLIWVTLCWSVLCLAPTFLVTFGKGNLGERYLYMPLAGLSLAVAMSLPRHRITTSLVVVFGLVSVTRIAPRNQDWQDYATLWHSAYRDRPSTYTAGGYAWARENIQGDLLGARELYMEALRGEPAYLKVCESAVIVHLRMGRPESSVAVAEWAHSQRQCAPTALYTDAYLYGLGGAGEHTKIRAIFGGPNAKRKPSPAATLSYASLQRDASGVQAILAGTPNPGLMLEQASFFLLEIVHDTATADWLKGQPTPLEAGVGVDRSP